MEKLKKAAEELKIQNELHDEIMKDMSFMYNRGMSLPLRMKYLEKENKKKSFVRNVVDKVKGWFS